MMKIGTIFRSWKILSISFLGMLMMIIQLPSAQAVEDHSGDQILLELALHKISLKYDVHFNYDRNIMDDVMVDYEEDNAFSLAEALDHVFENTHFGYRIFEQRYIVVFENNDEGTESLKNMINHMQDLVEERESVKKRVLQPVGRLSTLSAKDLYYKRFVFSVSGTIMDQDGEPLIGVNIQIKGSNKGTSTDFDGNFTLEDIDENAVLVVSYIGYQTQEIALAGESNLEIVMESDSQLLDEVVVIGMDNRQTKRSVTGSVATIETKDLVQSPVANLSNALAGRLPGLITVQASGEPGNDAAKMFIRGIGTYGNTAPLVVIDGLPRSQDDFNQLDANEIESVSILKDAASTALYGIQGANGVIVVTTKRGGLNQKPLINFTAQQAIQQPVRLPSMMSTYQQAEFYKELDKNNNQPERYNEEVMEIIKNNSDPYLYPNVNWFDALLKNAAAQNQYNLNISGSSTNNIRYFVSGSYIGQGTLLKYGDEFEKNYRMKTKFNRYNFRSNIDMDATKMLHIRIDLAGRLENQVGPGNGFSNFFNDITDRSPSAQPIFNPNGTLGAGSALNIPYRQNPYGMITQSGYYTNYTNNMYGTLSAKHDLDFITQGLSAQLYFSFENQNYRSTTRSQQFDSYWYRGVNNTGDPIYQQQGIYSRLNTSGHSSIERNNYLDLRINYNRFFGDHGVSGQILANRTLRVINDELPYAYQGVSGHFTYNYKGKYYGEVNIGYNGSENFPKKRRYGFFPAFSVGWIVSEEPFLQDVNWLNFLKLRASYGKAGNDKIGGDRWLFISDFAPGGGYAFGASPDGVPGYNENRVGNNYITWEQATKSNVGIDFSLSKQQNVQFSFDVFREKRQNILTPPGTVPDYIGIKNLAPRNTGIVLNRGFEGELKLNWHVGAVHLFSNLQLTYARNKVIQNDEPFPKFDYQDLRGHSVGTVLGYQAIGLFQDQADIDKSAKQTFSGTVLPGDIKYRDVNGDGVIDPNDRVPVQIQNVPRYVGGLSIGGSYQSFDFSLLLNGATGGSGYVSLYDGSLLWLDRWSQDNPHAKIPVAHSTLNNQITSDFFVQKTDYLKLRNAEIGYSLPKSILKAVDIQEARIYINGQNLFMWDSLWLKDRDPESVGSVYYVNYPIQRIFNLGVNVKF